MPDSTPSPTGRRYYAEETRAVYSWGLHSFVSRAARDAWCEKGAAYAGMPGYREAIPADHPEIRRSKQMRAYPGIQHHEEP